MRNMEMARNRIAHRLLEHGEIISDRQQSNAYCGVRITEVRRFGKIWQIVFIDGLACEIQRILPDEGVGV